MYGFASSKSINCVLGEIDFSPNFQKENNLDLVLEFSFFHQLKNLKIIENDIFSIKSTKILVDFINIGNYEIEPLIWVDVESTEFGGWYLRSKQIWIGSNPKLDIN